MRLKALFSLMTACVFISMAEARNITVSSFAELASAVRKSNQTIRMKPGKYPITEFLNSDSIDAKLKRKDYAYLDFNGNNNNIILKGVHFEIDTRLREMLRHPIHTSEIVFSGKENTIDGLRISCTGNGISPGGSVLQVSGAGNRILNFDITVRGSFPYGYGDLFGKGGPDVIRHKKHSGFLVTGNRTTVKGCKLHMFSYGHGFYIQQNVSDIQFEDCLVEGELRMTEDILAEKSGPAFDVNFRTWTTNREGKYVVTPGYMKSLCEDGFRTYGEIKNVSFKNCVARNTRGGFELRTNGGIRLENCTTTGTERAYWIGNGAIVKNCKGDANYGPLLFVEGNHVTVDIQLLPDESDRLVHSLLTVQGRDNTIRITGKRSKPLPILIGFTHPEHGESMSPYSEGTCTGLKLSNLTNMPVTIGTKADSCYIISKGTILENKGNNIRLTLN